MLLQATIRNSIKLVYIISFSLIKCLLAHKYKYTSLYAREFSSLRDNSDPFIVERFLTITIVHVESSINDP